jgi:hypothetical protein
MTASRRARFDLLAAAILAISSFVVFRVSPVRQLGDSAFSLIHRRSFALDPYIEDQTPERHRAYVSPIARYQLQLVEGHVYYYFPPGSSVLSIPYVAVMNAFGVSAVRDGVYDPDGEARLEATLAAALMSAFVVLVFALARERLPRPWAIGVACVTAFGTQVWSTASRGMWSDTWCLVLMGGVALLLVRHERDPASARPVLLATLLSWAFFTRPTSAIAIIAVTLYLARSPRRFLVAYAATGAAWVSLFVAYSRYHFHALLPVYYASSSFSPRRYGEAFLGNLVSPARGLLVYVPVLLVVFWTTLRLRERLSSVRLSWLSIGVIVPHLFVVAAFEHWWGGHSYGPRFTTGLLPWFVIVAVLGIEAMLRERALPSATRRVRSWTPPLVIGAITIFWGGVVHAAGALAPSTWIWNDGIDEENGERVWSWRHAQFLAPLQPPRPLPANPSIEPLPLDQRIAVGNESASIHLGDGWGLPEGAFRWTQAAEVSLALTPPPETVAGRELELRMKLTPNLLEGRLARQRLVAKLDGVVLVTFEVRDPAPLVYAIPIPRTSIREGSQLVLELPDSASPASVGLVGDERRLGVAVHWIELRTIVVDDQ